VHFRRRNGLHPKADPLENVKLHRAAKDINAGKEKLI
jgi:hypothetical protein